MTLRPPSRSRGIAIIVVLIVIVVLGILAGGFAYSMKVETTLARKAQNTSEMDWLGRSGFEIAKWVLAQGMQGPNASFDALNQKWAGGPGDTNNDVTAAIDLSNYQLGRATLSFKITDLDRKFNINVADEVILRQALTLIGVDASVVSSISDSVLDWIDQDDNARLAGAESMVYEAFDPPYMAKNGPIDDLTELLLLKGVTPAVYWGANAGGSLGTVLNRPQPGLKSHFEEQTYAVGLADLFTPLSSRLLNINTASATALQIFPEIDANVAQAIITARAGPDSAEGTADDTPFRNPAELARVPGMNPVAAQQFSRYFGVKSLVFEVRVSIAIDKDKREYIGILRRNSARDIQLLSMSWR
jgi:general secretion pathway protein K